MDISLKLRSDLLRLRGFEILSVTHILFHFLYFANRKREKRVRWNKRHLQHILQAYRGRHRTSSALATFITDLFARGQQSRRNREKSRLSGVLLAAACMQVRMNLKRGLC